jgi:hypothetical protein
VRVEVRKFGGVGEGFVEGQDQIVEPLVGEREMPLQPDAELDSGMRRTDSISGDLRVNES